MFNVIICQKVNFLFLIVACRMLSFKTELKTGADPGFDQGGPPDRDRPKTAILGPQFCRILVLGPHFWWSGGAPWICPIEKGSCSIAVTCKWTWWCYGFLGQKIKEVDLYLSWSRTRIL